MKTKYAKLNSLEDYQALNDKIGKAKSYPDEKSDTYFYSEPNPTDTDSKYYMEITPDIQGLYPSILEGIELIDKMPDQINHESI